MTVKEGITEIYHIARLAPMTADAHAQLAKLYEGIMANTVETPAISAPDNTTPIRPPEAPAI